MTTEMTDAIAHEYALARANALIAWLAAAREAERLWDAYQAAIDADVEARA